MAYDLSQIVKAFKAFNEMAVEAGKQIKKIFEENKEIILELMKKLRSIAPKKKKKKKYKPVLEIKPSKIVILNKRLNNYYCRNNC